MKFKVLDTGTHKCLETEDGKYHYIFNKHSGGFARWGETEKDDPAFSPVGPELADIELSTICHGPAGRPCSFCYKGNGPRGKSMSLETFQQIFRKFPPTLTQIAFGIGDIDGNLDLFNILSWTRAQGVVPNLTVNGSWLSDKHIELLAKNCGAIAVSNYGRDICYRAVQRLSDARFNSGATLKQVNIHQLLSAETLDQCWDLVMDLADEKREDYYHLSDHMDAVVFLSGKPKGRGTYLNKVSKEDYQDLVDFCLGAHIPFGFDSCGSANFLRAAEPDQVEFFNKFVESCESTRFSIYIDVDGNAWPCSFCPDAEGIEPTNLLTTEKFSEVWNGEQFNTFRQRLEEKKCCVSGAECYQCPVFDVEVK